jgi:predicted nuclease of predicted toxin-antitoxin system
MRFLVDECAGPALANWLSSNGHEVYSVYHESRGLTDESLILKALSESWIIVTADKGFGEMIYKEHRVHCGTILLRLRNERPAAKISAVSRLLDDYANQLEGRFVVVTEDRVRFATI